MEVQFGNRGSLYFGTIESEIDPDVAAFVNPFAGCIGDLTINGVVVDFNELSEGVDVAIGRCSGPGITIKKG